MKVVNMRTVGLFYYDKKSSSTSHRRNACLRHYGIRSGHDLDLCPLTLKISSEVPNDMMNICSKFH